MAVRDKVDMEQLKRSIGAGTCRARKRLGFTQEDVAELIGISVEFYARIDRGYGVPSVPILRKIAIGLNVSLDELLGTLPPGVEPTPPLPTLLPATAAMHDTPRELRRLTRHLKRTSPGVLEGILRAVECLQELLADRPPCKAKDPARRAARKRRRNQ